MINLTVVIDNDEAIKKLKELQNVAKSTTSSVVKDSERIDDGFSKIENTLKSLAAGISMGALVRQIVQVRGEVQQLEVAFETMLGSKEKADKLVNEAVQLAAKTPFGLQDVSNGAKMLLAYGSAAEEVTEEIKMLGNIASGLSIPLNDLIYLYGTTRTQGQLFTQDLRQFMGRGIPLAEELAKQFGVTKDEVGALVTAGKVGFDDMAKALQSMTGESGQFYNLMEKQSKTITGQISNLEDSIYQMFNAIGEKSEGVISESIDVVASLVENYERVGRVLIGLVATYGTYKAAVMAYNAITAVSTMMTKGWTLAEIAHYNALVLVNKAQKLLNATMLTNHWVLAATAVASLVALLISQKNETERLREAEEEYNNAKQDTINKEQEHMRAVEELMSVAESEASSTDNRKAALHRLIEMYPSVFAQYSTEYDMLLNIKKIKQEIAAIEAGKSITNPKNELASIEQQIAKLKTAMPSTLKEWGQAAIGTYGRNQDIKIKQLEDRKAVLQAQIAQEERAKYLEGLGGLDRSEVEAGQKAVQDKIDSLKLNGTQTEADIAELKRLESEQIIFNAEIARRDAPTKTVSEYRAEANKKAAEAAKALRDFDKSNKKLTTEEAKKKRKELVEAKKAADEEAKKWAPIGGGGKKGNAKQQEAARKAEQEAKLTNQLLSQNEDMRIELMEEGSAKEIAQIERDYDKRVEAIRRQELELLKTRKELTKEQEEAIKQALADAEALRNRDIKKINEENANAYNDYLAEYGTLQEQKVAIAAKYDREIAEAEAAGNKALVAQLTNDRLVAEAKFADDVVAFADSIKNYSEEQLLSSIDQMEAEAMAAKAKLEGMGSSDSEEYKAASKALAELVGRINVAKDAYDKLTTPSPEQKALARELEKMGKIVDGVASQISAAADIVGEFDEELGNSVRTIGEMIPSIYNLINTLSTVSAAAEAAGRSLNAMEKASVILAAIGVALQFVKAGVDSVKKVLNSEFDEFEKLKEQYNGVSEIWTELIEKKKEYLELSYGQEAKNAGREALDLIEEEERLNRDMARERTDTRRERKKVVQNITVEGYNELVEQGLAVKTGSISDFINDGNYGQIAKRIDWSKLLNMTPEELENLKQNSKAFWASLDGDLKGYLENIIATGEKSEEVHRMLQESLTQISFDELSDSFFDAMMDMDATAEEVANNVSEYFFKAMMMANMGEAYKEKLTKWYEDFYAAMNDADGLTDAEREELRKRYTDIVEQGIAERDAIADATGYGDVAASKQTTSKGFQAMSQETGSELNGRFTDIQGQTHRIAEAVEFCRRLYAENLTQVQSINSTVASIHNDTTLIEQHTRVLGQMGEDLASIKKAIYNGEI